VEAEAGLVGDGGVVGSAAKLGPKEQREWLGRVDEAYFSASSSSSGSESESGFGSGSGSEDEDEGRVAAAAEDGEVRDAGELDVVDGISRRFVHDMLDHWARVTGVELQRLVYTSYRKVESDVGKKKQSDVERVAGLASSLGGGW
ncbi:hypothetical protein AOQ84DRAFT_360051, partial [Glonium stellatum]